MILGTSDNSVEINEYGEIIRREKDGKALTEKKEDISRD